MERNEERLRSVSVYWASRLEHCQPSDKALILVSVLVSVGTHGLPNLLLHSQMEMEARVGIEPTNAAFAEPCLTTWLPRLSASLYLTSHPARASNCLLLVRR